MLQLEAHLFGGRLLGRCRAAAALERANRTEAEHPTGTWISSATGRVSGRVRKWPRASRGGVITRSGSRMRKGPGRHTRGHTQRHATAPTQHATHAERGEETSMRIVWALLENASPQSIPHAVCLSFVPLISQHIFGRGLPSENLRYDPRCSTDAHLGTSCASTWVCGRRLWRTLASSSCGRTGT